MSDRTVHATIHAESVGDVEVVRYDRAGKWWLEFPGGQRERVTLEGAAFHAGGCLPTVDVHFGLPGGSRFDSKVREFQWRRSGK